MLKFLFTILFFGLILVSLLGFSVIRSFKSFFFGSPKNKDKQRTVNNRRRTNNTNKSQNTTTQQYHQPRKKVFAEDEGEYTDYEEIKD